MPVTAKILSSIPSRGEVSCKLYVVNVVSDLCQVDAFLRMGGLSMLIVIIFLGTIVIAW
jgi:hypothetical protein